MGQSDHLRCNAIFLQEPDNGDDNLALRCAYLKVTLGASASSPPAVVTGSGSTSDTLVWENDVDFPFWSSPSMSNFICLDSGTGGEPIVYFVGDDDGDPGNHTPGAAAEQRLMYMDLRGFSGAKVVSGDTNTATLGINNSRQVFDPGNGAFKVTSMPYAPYSGSNADVSASYHNIIFMEQRDVPGTTAMIRHRCFDLGSTAAEQDRFAPPLNQQPFDVSRDVPEAAIAMLGDGPPMQNNTTIGIYFKQGVHLWYNEYQPGAGNTWSQDSGVSNPYLVDDDGYPGESVVTWNMMSIAPFAIGSFDLLSKNPTFYVKMVNLGGAIGIPGSGLVARIFCRIRD